MTTCLLLFFYALGTDWDWVGLGISNTQMSSHGMTTMSQPLPTNPYVVGSLDLDAWDFIKMHAEEIGVDDLYLSFKSDARYYALVWMHHVHRIPCLTINKRDRRSWVVISDVRT